MSEKLMVKCPRCQRIRRIVDVDIPVGGSDTISVDCHECFMAQMVIKRMMGESLPVWLTVEEK